MPASLFLKAGGATQLLILPEEIKHSSAPSAPLIYVCFSNIQVLTCAISADWRTESRGSGSSVSSDEVCGVAGAFSVDGLDDDIEPSILDDYFIAIKDIAELDMSRSPAARTLLQLLRAAAPNERVRPSNDPTTLIVVEHISNGMMHALAIPARCLVYAGSKQQPMLWSPAPKVWELRSLGDLQTMISGLQALPRAPSSPLRYVSLLRSDPATPVTTTIPLIAPIAAQAPTSSTP